MRISLVLINLYIILSTVFLVHEDDRVIRAGSTVFGLLNYSENESL